MTKAYQSLDELRKTKRFEQLVDRYLHRLATLTGVQESSKLRIILAAETRLTRESQATLVAHIKEKGVDYVLKDLQKYLLQQARIATTPKVSKAIENLSISRMIPEQAARNIFCERVEIELSKIIEES